MTIYKKKTSPLCSKRRDTNAFAAEALIHQLALLITETMSYIRLN